MQTCCHETYIVPHLLAVGRSNARQSEIEDTEQLGQTWQLPCSTASVQMSKIDSHLHCTIIIKGEQGRRIESPPSHIIDQNGTVKGQIVGRQYFCFRYSPKQTCVHLMRIIAV